MEARGAGTGTAGHVPGDGCRPDCRVSSRGRVASNGARWDALDGNHPIDPGGPGNAALFQTYCDRCGDRSAVQEAKPI